jgi:hypothetical protein
MNGKNDNSSEEQSSNPSIRIYERIANLLALSLVTGKPQPEQIGLLSAAGYAPSEIARLIGTTPNTVSVTLSQLRKGKTKTAKR